MSASAITTNPFQKYGRPPCHESSDLQVGEMVKAAMATPPFAADGGQTFGLLAKHTDRRFSPFPLDALGNEFVVAALTKTAEGALQLRLDRLSSTREFLSCLTWEFCAKGITGPVGHFHRDDGTPIGLKDVLGFLGIKGEDLPQLQTA